MNFFSRALVAIGILKSPQEKHQISKRSFNAASINRLTSSWSTSNTSIDADIHRALDTLRARSRDLVNNNVYARKFLQMCESNIVGPNGFNLQCQPQDTRSGSDGKIDFTDAAILESAFYKWSQRGICEISGQYSFVELQRQFVKVWKQDGEVLIRRIRDKNINEFGYSLQIIDVDRLDVNLNMALSSGNFIRMGIELNAWGQPVAYHLRTSHPGESIGFSSDGRSYRTERVLARDIFHCFRSDRPEQRRGVPRMVSAMLRIQMLDGYEEAALVAARTGASKMGFFTSPDGDISPITEGTDDQGEFVTDAEPGAFGILPKGYQFQSWNPDYPTQNHDVFIKSCLRGIASGWGVAYNSLANDLEGVSFSSIRSGTLEERDNWMSDQSFVIDSFLTPVFLDFVECGLLNGAFKMPDGTPLPASKIEKFSNHTWQGRRWAWVDPEKDINASVIAIKNNLADPYAIAAQMGLALEDVIAAIARANAMASANGLPSFSETQENKSSAMNSDAPVN